MKLRLHRNLRNALLTCIAGAASLSSGMAGTAYVAEGVNYSDIESSTRFYDTGKGYYLSWNMERYWKKLYHLYQQQGSFKFLGYLCERMPATATGASGYFKDLIDDSQTCWAQVSMNLVEYWHSYYGVFCKDTRKLPYGYNYDKKYLDAMGGTLSLQQNLIALDTFTNTGDCLDSYLDWFMLGDETPYFASVKESGNGGYWKEFFSKATPYHSLSKGAWVDNLDELTKWVPECLGYARNGDSYTLTNKGQLVYLGLTSDLNGGHGITCHGFETNSKGQVTVLYVTNSDDMEYKLFKLYVDSSLTLYNDAKCTQEWEYANASWYIDQVYAIDTPEVLQDMLAQYENTENPLKWTGSASKWKMYAESNLGYSLPDESSGWQVAVDDEHYPIFNHDANRINEFDDSASNSDVTVSGTVKTSCMLMSNRHLTYTFSGGAIKAGELRINGGGHTIFQDTRLISTDLNLINGKLESGSGAQLQFTQGTIGNTGTLTLNGGSVSVDALNMYTGSTLELLTSSSLSCTTLNCDGNTNFLFDTTDAQLTLSGSISATGPIDLQIPDSATLNEKYAIITFANDISNWKSLFQSSDGVLEYSDQTLYLIYLPFEQLNWEDDNGTWSDGQWQNAYIPTSRTITYFNGSNGAIVSISGTVTPYSVNVRNGHYTFNAVSANAALQVEENLTLNEGTSLANNVATSGKLLSLSSSSSYNAGADSTFEVLNMEADSHLGIAADAEMSIGQVNAAAGNMEVSQNGTLKLNSAERVSLSGTLTGNGEVWLGGGGTFSFSKDALALGGQLNVAPDTGLEVEGQVPVCSIKLGASARFRDAQVAAALSGQGEVTVSGTVHFSGANSYTGGTKLETARLSVSHATALGTGKISSAGTSSLHVEQGVTLVLQEAIENEGTLSLSGRFDASNLDIASLPPSRVNTEGVYGNSGFTIPGSYAVQLVNGGTTVDNGASIIYGDDTLVLSANGVASYINATDYSTYYIDSSDTASVSAIQGAAGHAQSDIILNDGSLTLDSDIGGSLTMNEGTLIFSGNAVQIAENLTIGPGDVNITLNGTYEEGHSYTLLTAGSIIGDINELNIHSSIPNQKYALKLSEHSLVLNVVYKGASLTWNGGKGAQWSSGGGEHWKSGSKTQAYRDGDTVIFDKAGSILLSGTVTPGAIQIRAHKNVTFKSDKKKPGSLSGIGNLTKHGAGTLTLNNDNSGWTGDTYLNDGTIKVTGTGSLGKGTVYMKSGTLNLGSKAVSNTIVQDGSAAIKSGKKFTGTYTLEKGELLKGSTLNIAKSATLEGGTVNGSLTGNGTVSVTGSAKLGDKGKITTKALTLGEDARLTTSSKGVSSKATTLTIGENALFSLGGKMTVDSLKLNGGELKTTAAKPAAMTVKNHMELTNATLTTNGKVTTNKLTLNESSMSIKGAKAQNLTVKQGLTIGSGSSLSLNGKLSTASLTLNNGATLTMSGSKPVTLKVKGALTLNSGSSVILNYNFVQGKTYKVLTFGSYSGSSDYYAIFGVDADDCTITNTGKALTLTVTGKWKPKQAVSSAVAVAPVSPARVNPVADALVQSNWGQLEASRAFVNAMANRSMAVQLGNGERSVWASAIGSSSRHSSANGHNGADTNVSGGAFGLETQVGRASLFGMALGNSWTRVSAHGFGTIEQDTTHLGLYGQTNWRSGVTADWSAAYGRSDSETMGTDWSQKNVQLDGRVSYNHELNANTLLSPFAGMQYYASDSATVNGTSTGSLQNLRAEIGVAASRRMGKFGVYGEIALHQDLARNNPKVEMEGVRYNGMNLGRTGLNFTVGASYELNDKWSVNASYTGEFVENANAHSANVGATYKF